MSLHKFLSGQALGVGGGERLWGVGMWEEEAGAPGCLWGRTPTVTPAAAAPWGEMGLILLPCQTFPIRTVFRASLPDAYT